MNLLRLVKHDLPAEARIWLNNGVISEAQADRILSLYGLSLKDADQRSAGQSLLNVMGLFFLGVALVLVVGRNWDVIPATMRVASLVGITFVANVVGVHRLSRGREKAGKGLLLMGVLAYGASIFSVAQMYHFSQDTPQLLVWWGLGVVPLLVGTGALRFNVLLCGISVGYLLAKGFDDHTPWYYLPFCAVSLWHMFRRGGPNLIFATHLIGLAFFIQFFIIEYVVAFFYAPGGYRDELAVQVAMVTFLLFSAVMSLWADLVDDAGIAEYRDVTCWCTAVLGFFILFCLSCSGPWSSLYGHSDFTVPTAVLWAGLMIKYLLQRALLKTVRTSRVEMFGASILLGYTILLFCLAPILHYLLSFSLISPNVADVIVEFLPSVCSNILTVLLSIAVINSGVREHRNSRLVIGCFLICVLGLMRYLDLIGDYLGAAALFAIQAFIMMLGAQILRRRSIAHRSNVEVV